MGHRIFPKIYLTISTLARAEEIKLTPIRLSISGMFICYIPGFIKIGLEMADWTGGSNCPPPGLPCKYFDVGLARVKIWSRMKNHVSHVKMDVTSLKMGLRFRQAVLDIWSNKQKNPMRGFVDLLTPCRTYLFFVVVKLRYKGGEWTLLLSVGFTYNRLNFYFVYCVNW